MGSSRENAARSTLVWTNNSFYPQRRLQIADDQPGRPVRRFENVGLESIRNNDVIPQDSGKSGDGGIGSSSMHQRIIRSKRKDCVFFVHVGLCSYGSTCRFNHPVPVDPEDDNGEDSEIQSENSTGNIPCKFYRAGICRNGANCRFSHIIPEGEVDPQKLNVLGLPFRLGEPECSFYLRTGMCGYGTACKFHHPDPIFYEDALYGPYASDESVEYQDGSSGTTEGGYAMQFPESAQQYYSPLNYGWNGYQVQEHTQEMNQYSAVPEENVQSVNGGRAGLPLITRSSLVLNDKGLPLRPGKSVCRHYEASGYCGYGRACAFDHPQMDD